MIGKRINMYGYASTSRDKTMAGYWANADDKKVSVIIEIEWTGSLYNHFRLDSKKYSERPIEKEVIL